MTALLECINVEGAKIVHPCTSTEVEGFQPFSYPYAMFKAHLIHLLYYLVVLCVPLSEIMHSGDQ